MVFKLKPREDKFFVFFNELAEAVCDAADILLEFSKTAQDAQGKAGIIGPDGRTGD